MRIFYDMVEWKNSQIPFTRGCSFFECSKQEERIIIKYSTKTNTLSLSIAPFSHKLVFLCRKAQIVIESPVKPGGLVLVTTSANQASQRKK
jgi:hypothetical protein